MWIRKSSFADDSNGSKTSSITFQFNVLQNDVAYCVNNIINWMNVQCLKINPDKTEIILFHPKSVQHQIIVGGTFIRNYCIRFSREVKNVGVWLDSQLNLNKQVNKVVSQCYMQVKKHRENKERFIQTANRNASSRCDNRNNGLLQQFADQHQ